MQRDEAKLREYYAEPPADITLDDIDLARIPRHVSIIMDGNGRWAQARGLDRSRGHGAGVDSLREAVTTSVRLGLDALSVYAFSTENWSRPQREVDLLMHLFATTLVNELPLFHQENVRLRFLGESGRICGRAGNLRFPCEKFRRFRRNIERGQLLRRITPGTNQSTGNGRGHFAGT